MINCPQCGSTLEEKAAVCDCGAILFGEVTNVSGWETETIFRVADKAKKRVIPALAVALAVALAIAALSWPRLSKSLVSDSESPASLEESVAQAPIKSDLVPTDDQIESDIYVNGGDRSSAFEFTSENKTPRAVRRLNTNLNVQNERASTATDAQKNSLDAELLRDSNRINNTADPADCKPEITASLKRPEPQPDIAEVKSEKKTSASGYVLGPRGGCFIVTASGGKKYVDRALCNSSTAAARQ